MRITSAYLQALNTGLNTAFQKGFDRVPSQKDLLAIQTTSTAKMETYAWMLDTFGIDELVGELDLQNLKSQEYVLFNKKWGGAITVERDDIEDDNLGMAKNNFAAMGEAAAAHPDVLLFRMMRNVFAANKTYGVAYDGKPYFAANHRGYNEDKQEIAWSNVQTGSLPAWFLFDLSRNYMKPFLFQRRSEVELQQSTNPQNEDVIKYERYLYKVRARYNVGLSWYQLATGSKAALTAENFAAAYENMSIQCRPNGEPLGVMPTHLFYGPRNLQAAKNLLEKANLAGGESNIWAGQVKAVYCPYLE